MVEALQFLLPSQLPQGPQVGPLSEDYYFGPKLDGSVHIEGLDLNKETEQRTVLLFHWEGPSENASVS